MAKAAAHGDASGTRPAPAAVNGFPVVAWQRKRTGPGELADQFYVICRDSRPGHREAPYIVWTVGYDPSYQGGQWVACNGRYGLTEPCARLVLDEGARGL